MAYRDYDIQTRQSSGPRKPNAAAAYQALRRLSGDKIELRVSIGMYTRTGKLPALEPSWVVECRRADVVHYVRKRIRDLMLELDGLKLETPQS